MQCSKCNSDISTVFTVTYDSYGGISSCLCNTCVNKDALENGFRPLTYLPGQTIIWPRDPMPEMDTESGKTDKAIKHDEEKIPVELLPTQALEEIAKVLAFGKVKYTAFNWAKGFKWTRLIGAAMRHLFAWQRGEDKDKESGLSHLAHLGCCVLFLLQHEISGLGEDDRYKEFTKEKK